MNTRYALAIAGLATGIGCLVLPALAQTQGEASSPSDRSIGGMGHSRSTNRNMMGGMMSGGCAGMMQSMNGGDGRPNSQWRTHPRDDGTPD